MREVLVHSLEGGRYHELTRDASAIPTEATDPVASEICNTRAIKTGGGDQQRIYMRRQLAKADVRYVFVVDWRTLAIEDNAWRLRCPHDDINVVWIH